MQKGIFLLIMRAIGANGDLPTGPVLADYEYNKQLAEREDEFEWVQSCQEHYWKTTGRATAERLVRLFVAAARYLSDLIGGDVPLLAPRADVEASVNVIRSVGDDAVRLGNAVQRAIKAQVIEQTQELGGTLAADIEKILAGAAVRAIPSASKRLGTNDIAARLNRSSKVVQRLCSRGEIDADKTAGGQWWTTEARLNGSPYLKGKKRGRKGNAPVE